MLDSNPPDQRRQAAMADLRSPTPHLTFVLVALGFALLLWGAVSATFGYGIATIVAISVFGVTSLFAVAGLSSSHPFATVGPANMVTLGRAAMMAFLAGAAFAPELMQSNVWLYFGVAIVAFALDGVDGMIARATAMTSPFGARFDMEVDAALGAALCLLLLTSGTVGFEILVLGFTRYVFVAAGFIWPWLMAPLPESFRRKAICVIQIAALIALVFPLTPAVLIFPISVVASVALLASFAIDVRWLLEAAK